MAQSTSSIHPQQDAHFSIDDLPDAVIRTDMRFVVTDWNRAAERLYGWTADEAIGQALPELLDSEFTNTDTAAAVAELWRNGTWQGESRSRRKDGELIDLFASVTLLYDDAGTPVGAVSINRPISAERSQALTGAMREQEFKTLVTNATDVIARLDADLRFIYLNPATQRYTDIPLHQLIGKSLHELNVPRHFLDQIQQFVARVTAAGRSRQEAFAIPADNGLRHFLLRLVPEQHDDETVTFLAIGRDITTLKQTEQTLLAQTEALRLSHDALEQKVRERTRDLRQTVEAEQHARRFAELLNIANQTLAAPLELEEVLDTIIDCVAELVPYDSACIMLIDQQQRYKPTALRGYEKWMHAEQVEPFFEQLDLNPAHYSQILQGEAVLIEDSAEATSWRHHPETSYIRCWMGVPLVFRGEVIGLYSLDKAEPHGFTETHRSLALAFAPQAAAAINNAQMHAREVERAARYEREAQASSRILMEQYRRQTSINEFNLAALGYADIPQLLARITELTEELLPASGGSSIVLWDQIQENFVHSAGSGEAIKGDYAAANVRRTGGATRWIIEHRKPMVVPDIEADPFGANPMLIKRGLKAYVGVPLVWHGQTLGVLYALSREKRDYPDTDIEFLVDLAGRAAAIIGRLQLNNELARANAELARSSRLKDEFMANMSHELRTPLDAIIARAELLLDGLYGDLQTPQERPLRVIESSATHLLQLINDILDLTRIESGKIELRLARVDVATLCHASIQFVHERAVSKRVTVHKQVDPAATWLIADEVRLKQILVNLLTNAVKFTPSDGQIGLSAVALPEHHAIRFEVWDTGIGIDEADLDKLFERFTQLSSGLTRNFEGVGLGLALVKRLAHLHSGEVAVESSVGQGSRFIVTVPVEQGDPFPANVRADAPVATQPAGRRRTATLLVVDDNEPSLELRNEFLSTFGYRVIQARDGDEAIQSAIAETPDLIIMDIQMPRLDGLAVIRDLRARPSFATVPIIVQTALAMPGDRERCLEAGADSYLAKPTAMQVLLQEVERLLPDEAPLSAE